MLTPEALRRLMLDALAEGDDRDGFRTRLRAALKAADAAQAADEAAAAHPAALQPSN